MGDYRRSPEMTEKLLLALREALFSRPGERFGQIVEDATRSADLWEISDGEMLGRIQDYYESIDGALP